MRFCFKKIKITYYVNMVKNYSGKERCFLRKYGTNKRNPNPPWPSEQSVVVVPNGVTASAVGKHGEKVRSMICGEAVETAAEIQRENLMAENANAAAEAAKTTSAVSLERTSKYIPDVPEERERPFMGFIPETSMRNSDMVRQNQGSSNISMGANTDCGMMNVNSYLCGQTGKFVRIEFLFGENTHIEKTGVLKSVGKDFIVLSETGTNNSIICSVNNIKFINVYNINGRISMGGFETPLNEM